MAKKILTYREVLMDQFKHPHNNDPENLDNLVYVGRYGATVIFSFEDEQVDIQENQPENEQKIWDLSDPVEASEMKQMLMEVTELRQKLASMEQAVAQLNMWRMLKGVIDKDNEILDLIRSVDKAKDDYLKGLGFPGMSIIAF